MPSRDPVYIDFDRTLADYRHGSGFATLPPPLPGAKEFVEAVRKLPNVSEALIYSCRTSQAVVSPEEALDQAHLIRDWLLEHEVPADGVYVGTGKPDGAAFVDDKGVTCRPQEDGPAAYGAALAMLERITGATDP